MTQPFLKLKKKYFIIIMISILLLKNLMTAERFNARLAQAKWVTKANIADFAKKANFDEKFKKDEKVTSNKANDSTGAAENNFVLTLAKQIQKLLKFTLQWCWELIR